jgi:hypothetical protein
MERNIPGECHQKQLLKKYTTSSDGLVVSVTVLMINRYAQEKSHCCRAVLKLWAGLGQFSPPHSQLVEPLTL